MNELAGTTEMLAYDRRGFGESPLSHSPFRHIDDLAGVIRQITSEPAWLIGSSQGGRVAIDTALAYPDLVRGLILLAPAVSGAPESDDLDPATEELDELITAAEATGDLEAVNRLEARLWLDGPGQPEGRVDGPSRDLLLEMNGPLLRNQSANGSGDSGINAWDRLSELQVPTTVAWGDLDVPLIVEECVEAAARIPGARQHILAGMAHLPYLESATVVAELIRDAVTSRRA
jgi:pimeloyl-ACP methyl ester carboxylesterase